MNFQDLRWVYSKLVFVGWQQRWLGGQLQLQFQYQLVADPARVAELRATLANQAADVDWLASLTTKTFTHKLKLRLKKGQLTEQADLDGLIFQIGIAEAINYWKLACPAEIEIACGALRPEQVAFWQKLIYKGLGEFIYLNKLHLEIIDGAPLSAANFVKITSSGPVFEPIRVVGQGSLIPVGGGKDSVVTLEVLRDQRDANLPLVMSAPQAAYDCIMVAGYNNYLEVNRQLDPQILALNQAGFLNGHVPFSAILAFISVLGAVLTGKRHIALSNENSANEPSVPGTDFNHQYSKSWEFEADFRAYLQQFVVEGVEYFSLLRPLEELQIAELFSHYPAYHPVFRSCNVGKKTNSWCGHCPKCLFVFIMLAAFVDYQQVVAMFGRDLLADVTLLTTFDQLLGLAETKPFECVGTVSEVRRALRLIIQRNYPYGDMKNDKNQLKMPILLQKFVEYNLDDVELSHDEEQAVPAELLVKLQQERERYGV